MTAFLLSTQSFLDRLSGNPKYAIYKWLDEQKTQNTKIYLSVVSIGYAKEAVGTLDDPMEREKYSRALDKIVGGLRKGALLPVDETVANEWAKLLGVKEPLNRYETGRRGSAEVELSEVELLVVTAALVKNLPLVEPGQPYHAELAKHGLTVETLGE